MPSKPSAELIWMLVGICLGSVPLFIHLDYLPIRNWDEARLAIKAMEMHQNGNLLVAYFEGAPDMWSTKPPLMIWAQALAIELVGLNELAIRLPAAVASLLTCLLLMLFSKKAFDSYVQGVLAALVLVTINRYTEIHVSRSGDYEAPLILFTTAFCLSFFLYLQKQENAYLHVFLLPLHWRC